MISFSVKVNDELHERLQRQLRANGKSRSGFVRELLERELGSAQTPSRQVQHPMARFKGIVRGPRNSRDDAFRVNEILVGGGYGADGADS